MKRLQLATAVLVLACGLAVAAATPTGALASLVGRADATTHALAIDASGGSSGTDNTGAIGSLVGATTATNALKVYFDAGSAVVIGGTSASIQFGGTTSAFPMWERSGTVIMARLADDSTGATIRANTVQAEGTIQLGSSHTLLFSSNTPTISSGFGTSPSVVAGNGVNGPASFTVNVGTGGSATSGVLGLATAANGWNCFATDQSTNVVTRQTASTASTATLTAASAWTASDVLLVSCFPR